MIYLDNAATTCLSDGVVREIISNIDKYENPSALYSSTSYLIEKARKQVASLIGAEPRQIFFTSGATESNNWVLQKSERDVVTSNIEHPSVLNNQIVLHEQGRLMHKLSVDTDGLIKPADLNKCIEDADGSIGLSSFIWVNNETGVVQPMKKLCKVAHKNHIPIHTDATQAVGHIHIDVNKIPVDYLTASGHKLHAPKGIGFLYARKPETLPPFIYGGGQEEGYRSGTENLLGIIALGKACEEAKLQLNNDMKHYYNLTNVLTSNLYQRNISTLYNNFEHIYNELDTNYLTNVGHIHSFAPKMGVDSISLVEWMSQMDISISNGSACSNNNKKASYVLKALHLEDDVIDRAIRVSFSRYTTTSEVMNFVSALSTFLKLVH